MDIIIEYEYLGYGPDDTVDAHPHFFLSQVHDAFSYYYENREEMNREISLRKDNIGKLRKKISS